MSYCINCSYSYRTLKLIDLVFLKHDNNRHDAYNEE